jgi:hypothetical protein
MYSRNGPNEKSYSRERRRNYSRERDLSPRHFSRGEMERGPAPRHSIKDRIPRAQSLYINGLGEDTRVEDLTPIFEKYGPLFDVI